jgi:hypothetical protein
VTDERDYDVPQPTLEEMMLRKHEATEAAIRELLVAVEAMPRASLASQTKH